MSDLPQHLIVGLGNPGREHSRNRHNAGFMLVDHLAELHAGKFSLLNSSALVARVVIHSKAILLAKPQTFMNRSGSAVHTLLKKYPLELGQLLVAYDEIDLPLERLRLLPSGGTAGHKGLDSIRHKLGSQQFPRLRLGVGRPPGRKEAADYVLSNFAESELEHVEIMIRRASDCVGLMVKEGLEAAMTHYNVEP